MIVKVKNRIKNHNNDAIFLSRRTSPSDFENPMFASYLGKIPQQFQTLQMIDTYKWYVSLNEISKRTTNIITSATFYILIRALLISYIIINALFCCRNQCTFNGKSNNK